MHLPLSRPDITERERRAVMEVLESPYLSMGRKIEEFEAAIARLVGARHAVAVNSGTSALHLAVLGLGIGEGDEVITTPFSFVASSNCVLYARAKPVFVDIDPKTLCLDPNRVEAAITPRTKAILAVDVFGHPAALDDLRDIARRKGLFLIEDACEALGSEYKGIPAGSPVWADVATFAFYPNKQITTGEGGCLVTDSDELAAVARSLRNQGRGQSGAWLVHERLGYNYRLDEMSAALGLAQLQRLEEILAARSAVADCYEATLAPLVRDGWLELPYVNESVTSMSWFVYVVRLSPRLDRDKVMVCLKEQGVDTRPYFTPIHLQPYYRKHFGYKEGDFPITEYVARRTLALPFYNQLREIEIQHVTLVLKKCLGSVCMRQP